MGSRAQQLEEVVDMPPPRGDIMIYLMPAATRVWRGADHRLSLDQEGGACSCAGRDKTRFRPQE